MKIDLRSFAGEIPRVGVTAPLNLPDKYAHSCENTKLTSSSLRPFGGLRRVWTPTKSGTIQTLYRFGAQQGQDIEATVGQVQNTTPVRIVTNGHGLTTGRRVYVMDTGLGIDGAEYQVTVVDANTFSLNGTTASGTSTAGYWTALSGFWFHWPAHVHVIRGPIPGDTEERTYWTGDGFPKMSYGPLPTTGGNQYPTNAYRLGVPAPETIPVITLAGDPNEEVQEVDRRSLYYVVTYVTEVGEEGPPSDPSSTAEWSPGQTVELTSIPTGPSGGAFNIVTKRIYRVDLGDEVPRFVAEIPLAQSTFSDPVEITGEVLPSLLWDMPPEDMHGLGVLASGVCYGFSRNRLCLSEPFLPHAWPYQRTANHDFIGGGHFDTTVVALTRERAYVAQGYDPRSTQLVDSIEQGCVSARSIVSIPGLGVAYASPDGLVLIGPGGAQIATESYLSRDEWQALNPSSMRGVAHDGFYMGFYTLRDGTKGGFIFDPTPDGLGWVPLDVYADGAFRDPMTDSVYLVVDGHVERWDAMSPMVCRWRSKPWRAHDFLPNTALVVASGPVTFRVIADGAVIVEKFVTSNRPFRVGVHQRYERIAVEVEGDAIVERIALADAIEELDTV